MKSLAKELNKITALFDKVSAIESIKKSVKELKKSNGTKVIASGIKRNKDFTKYDALVISQENEETNEKITRRIKASLKDVRIDKFSDVVGNILGIKIGEDNG